MHPKEALQKLLRSLGVDIRQAIIGLFVVGIISAYGGLLYLSKAALDYSILLLTTPTPIWATILLVLLGCLYIYLQLRKSHSYSDSPQETTQSSETRLDYITIGDHKWQVAIFNNGSFSVDKYPFCKKHDLKFIYRSNCIYCPEVDKGNCKNELYDRDQFKTYETAKSYIEKEIRTRHDGVASLKKEPLEPASASSPPDSPRRSFPGFRIPRNK